MTQQLTTDRQYKQWVIELKNKIGAAQIKASLTVNRELLELYWELGREIYEKQQTANWGEALIDQLSRDLTAMFPNMKGFSKRNLFYIRKWFLFYQSVEIVPQLVGQIDGAQIVQQLVAEIGSDEKVQQAVGLFARTEKVPQVVAEIPWGHNCVIISHCSNVSEALFYVRSTIEHNWSRAVLVAQMESKLYARCGKTINNFDVALSKPQADLARETLKNPYNFDFLMLGKDAQERDLEHALTDHIQKFIMELGQGFAYMGRQNIKGPLGVAEYQIMSAVPDDLKGELPSVEELEMELAGNEKPA